MESEKVKEIKKALENCQKNNCLDCPYFIDEKNCRANDLLLDTLTLINELESENERLKNKNYQLEQDLGQCENGYKLELHTARYQLHSANEDLKKAQDRIAELEKEIEENAFYSKGYAQGIKNTYEVVIPDKLKQFAKMLKEKIFDLGNIVNENDIDETLKEFISQNN